MSSERTSILVEPLTTGTLISNMAKPIMGPPAITFCTVPLNPPHCSIRSENGVPIRTRRFFGCAIPVPVTLIARSINGCPSLTASDMAAAVPTLETTTPISSGSAPGGVSLSRIALISMFSQPCGYLTSSGATSMLA